METNNQKIVRIEQSPHDSAPIHWIEFPAYRVELSIDPTDRTTASCGMDWITVDVWDCTHGGSGSSCSPMKFLPMIGMPTEQRALMRSPTSLLNFQLRDD